MVVPLVAQGLLNGLSGVPYIYTVLKIIPWIALIVLLKFYFGGAKNRSERVMHGKVVIVTVSDVITWKRVASQTNRCFQGGTSGIGTAVVQALASRGAQIILLTRHAPTDPFLVDYIEDLRATTNNELIYAEQVDLASLHSIRLFATKWVDNAPPRRLDMIVLCANVMTPAFGTSKTTMDGLEEEWAVNYIANFHLLSILSPAIRAQPPDRDVRVLFSTCNSYIGATMDLTKTETTTESGSTSFARSKLALMAFAMAFQKHLDSYTRPDKQPNQARAFIIDPGFSRTPGTRRWLTGGTLWGLLLYVLTWPLWWLILKSPEQGAQSYLLATMEAEFGRGAGGKMIKECSEMQVLRTDVKEEAVAKQLWEFSEKQIEQLEKEGAVKRALAKKETEAAAKKGNASSTTTSTSNANDEKEQSAGSRRSRKGKS